MFRNIFLLVVCISLKYQYNQGEMPITNTSSSPVKANIRIFTIEPKMIYKTNPFLFEGTDGKQTDGSGDDSTINTEETTTVGREELEETDEVSIRVKVSDIPQEFVKVTGKKLNISDTLGNNVTIVRYLGIPFGLPPVDNFRFQRPSLNILQKDFTANELPPPCPQLSPRGDMLGDENCLFLNIYVPEDASLKEETETVQERITRLPVLVWFHGESVEKLTVYQNFGILMSGSAADLEPDVFVQKKIVVVTPQYRLGSLGFLSTVNEDLNGNMGIFDQLLALEWVNRFISAFGGDSKQITIMGHGGSAMTLGLLATSELARGLFHRVILMAGSPLSPVSVDNSPKSTFAEIALQNACPSFPTLRFVRCMQHKSVSKLVDADFQLTSGKNLGNVKMPLPIVQRNADGRFLPPIVSLSPSTAFTTGNFEQVPLILGVSAAEMAGFLPSLAGKSAKEVPTSVLGSNAVLKQFIRSFVSRGPTDPEVVSQLVTFEYFAGLNVTQRVEQAVDLLEEMISDFLFNVPAIQLAKLWSRFAPVYFYVFDYVRSGTGQTDESSRQSFGPNQAIHGGDINFLLTGHKGSSADRQVSEPLQEFWVNFIHKGSPLHSGIDWPQFREDTRAHILFRDQVEVSRNFRIRQDFLWNNLLEGLSKRECPPRRKTNTNRNSVITFKDPEDFLKYTSALSPRGKKVISEVNSPDGFTALI
ncbi:unnamed protein product [Allacma fusca]|uniref:Carboxylesterase type B domain-containing protein n=1 Tax=Allacma fusca TaxID=39272 RepID=A0A8J2JAM5_9HEXA|nr:unnamed protein product [Allacma fusca]